MPSTFSVGTPYRRAFISMIDPDAHIAPPIRSMWMTEEAAIDAYLDYEARHGEAHALLACHAAFPLLVDPVMVNLIRINFVGEHTTPWIAEADFLLSSFCRPFENGFYHVDPVAREVLLDVLRTNHPNGRKRLNELADFTLSYAQEAHILDPDSPIARSQRWVSWSYLYPDRLAEQLTKQLETSIEAGSRRSMRHIEIATMLEITRGPLAAALPEERYNELAEAAGVIASYYYRGRTITTTPQTELAQKLAAKYRSIQASDEPQQISMPAEESSETLSGLPEPTPYFVNRERETNNIASLLTESRDHLIDQVLRSGNIEGSGGLLMSKPVVALEGPAGSGKRELALHIANTPLVQQHFDGGVLWVDGNETESFQEAGRQILAQLDVLYGQDDGLESLSSTIGRIVYERRCLLVIANLDRLIGKDTSGWGYFWDGISLFSGNIATEGIRTLLTAPSRFLVTGRSVGHLVVNSRFDPELFSLSPLSIEAAVELISMMRPIVSGSRRLYDLAELIDRKPATVIETAEALKELGDEVNAVIDRVQGIGPLELLKRFTDHIESPELRELMPWVMLLRRVSLPILSDVFLSVPPMISSEELARFLEALYTGGLLQSGPFEGSSGPYNPEKDTAKTRRDLRRAIIRELRTSDPYSFEQFQLSAIGYFEQSEKYGDRVEEIYHRLWLNRDFEIIDARWMKGVELGLYDPYQDLPMPAKGYLAGRLEIEMSEEDQEAYRRALAEAEEPVEKRLSRAGRHLEEEEYEAARAVYEDALSFLSNREIQERRDIEYNRRAMVGLAKSLEGVGQIEDAGQYFKEALNYVELEVGPGEPDADECREELAAYYRRHGRLEEEERWLREIFEHRLDILGEDSDLTRAAYYEFVAFYERSGRFGSTSEIYQHIELMLGEVIGEERLQAIASSAGRESFEPEMVFVPAGVFLMGSTKEDELAREDEFPQHEVYLSDYWIGKFPVTNAEYQHFVRETGHRVPGHWNGRNYPDKEGEHPVVGVSCKDAIAYCSWLSEKKRKHYSVPTEAQWEKAARGTDGRIYPWGNEWDPDRLNSIEVGSGDTRKVGSFSPIGDSHYGCCDMAGNVWEWCADLYEPQAYDDRTPRTVRVLSGSGSEYTSVLRGGSYDNEQQHCRCAARLFKPSNFRDNLWGFRVVLHSPMFDETDER